MKRKYWESDDFDREAQRLYESGDYEIALQVLREGLARHPNSADLQVSLGYTQLAREEYGWARRAFDEALSLRPGLGEAMVGLGDALLKLGERPRALLAFHRVLEEEGDDPGLVLAVARALYREELYRRALEVYRRLPDDAEARAEAGYTFYQLGQRDDALRCLERALDLDPKLHEARVFYGNLLYERGDYEGALEELMAVPPREVWDPLAVWRVVELMRGFRGAESDSPRVRTYLERLEELSVDPEPEDRILAEVESAVAETRRERHEVDRHQLDLFVLRETAPRGRDRGLLTVRVRDGRVLTGDSLSIVRAMRDRSTDPTQTVTEYMRRTARLVRDVTGIPVPDDDPEAFLRASARAGLLDIER